MVGAANGMVVGGCAWFGGGVGKGGVLSALSLSFTRAVELGEEKIVCGEE